MYLFCRIAWANISSGLLNIVVNDQALNTLQHIVTNLWVKYGFVGHLSHWTLIDSFKAHAEAMMFFGLFVKYWTLADCLAFDNEFILWEIHE